MDFGVLAHIGEISFAINVGYSELDRFKYLTQARDKVFEIELMLKDGNKNVHGEDGSVFVDLYKQVKELFSDDKDQRNAAWYTCDKDNGNKKRYYGFSRWVYPKFAKKQDHACSVLSAVLAVISVVVVAILSAVSNHESTVLSSWGQWAWWGVFVTSVATLLAPVLFRVVGKKLLFDVERILSFVSEQKNNIAIERFENLVSK